MHWLVGDIQGCAKAFEALLTAVRFDPNRDHLWCLGDLVNRGPDSLATLRLWRDVGGQAVLGNHDLYALSARRGRWPRRNDTLDQLFLAPDCDELLARLESMPVLKKLEIELAGTQRPIWLVHGGVHPSWHGKLDEVAERFANLPLTQARLEDPEVRFVTTVRCCTRAGDRSRFDGKPEACPLPYRPWDEFARGVEFFVHGHWAWRGYYRGANSIGLDSGCVYGGPLTAYCVEEDRIEQIQSV
jgi:bis(5'-nucleosyl)-tetraphosphatase (symmetrical)